MKKGILILLLATSFSADAQSIKDLLYSGKLKTDSNTVVRKSDDLSTKIDTAAKKPKAEKVPPITAENIIGNDTSKSVSAVTDINAMTDTTSLGTDNTEAVKTAAPKSNTKLWKEYTDSLTAAMKAEEVLASKKLKKGTYYITLDYELGTDGKVEVLNVFSSPENEYLQNQVKDRLLNNPPYLAPILDSAGSPRKVKRKQNFVVTKE